MKIISIAQPYATLISIGAKKIETRSWQIRHRGPLGIHASYAFPQEAKNLCLTEPFKSVLMKAGYKSFKSFPLGQILATVKLVDCLDISHARQRTDPQEFAFGDYLPGMWGWVLEDVYAFPSPIKARGKLGLWDYPLKELA